jgi:hypothetical protein
MSLIMTKPQGDDNKKFDPHPEGAFMAVCRDIYIDRKPNPKYPGTSPFGRPEPQELVKVVFEFLTDEPIEIGGQMLPRLIRYRANASWHEDSNLRKFVSIWNPAIGKQDTSDLEALVGAGAYLTITQSTAADGKIWSNIQGAAAPPRGASIPAIPTDFARHAGGSTEETHYDGL